MITTVLVLLISVLAVLQTGPNKNSALIFALFYTIQEVAWSNNPDNGHLYFGISSLSDFILIYVLGSLHVVSKLTTRLMDVCVGFIIVNFIGWVMWMCYLPLTLYQGVCVLLYLAAITNLLNRGHNQHGNYNMGSWHKLFRVTYH